VVVVPDYALAPECPYPQGLNEIFEVYLALDSHRPPPPSSSSSTSPSSPHSSSLLHTSLPFVRCVAVAGESAGGNLAAALVLRLIAHRGEDGEDGGEVGHTAIKPQGVLSEGIGWPPGNDGEEVEEVGQEGSTRLVDECTGDDGGGSGGGGCDSDAGGGEDGAAKGGETGSSSSSSSTGGGADNDAGEGGGCNRLPTCHATASEVVRMPVGLVLAYPALNLSLAPSPSRAVHHFDPVLGIGIMYAVLRMYPPPHLVARPHSDPFLSPYHAPDALLRGFPPTHLMAGGFDPLLDDAVDFDTRLRRLNVPSSLHVEPALPHGFLGLAHTSAAASRALETGTAFLEASLAGCKQKRREGLWQSRPAPPQGGSGGGAGGKQPPSGAWNDFYVDVKSIFKK